jgi:hypothetical protein
MKNLYVLFVLFFIFTVAALAQETTNNASFETDSYVRYMPSSDRQDAPGEVELIETGSEYTYKFKVADKMPVEFSIAGKYIGIEENVNVPLPSHLTAVNTDIETYLLTPYEDLYLGIGVSPSFYGEDWDYESGAFRIPVRSYLVYQPSEELTWLAGVAVYPDFDNEVWPVLGLIYKPNEQWYFNLTPKRPSISYKLSDRLTFFVEGGLTNSEFEVKRNNIEGVVLKYKEMHLGSGVKLDLNQYLQTSLSVGGSFNRQLKYRDGRGKVNIDNGLYAEFRLQTKF